jgi:hypothetical protein
MTKLSMSELATPYLLANYEPIPVTGCWLWLGGWSPEKYGKVGRRSKFLGQAHRMFYELRHGPIPAEMVVCHKCDTPPCVNPDHLVLGTQADNMADLVAKGRALHLKRKPPVRLCRETRQAIASSRERTAVLARRYGISGSTVKSIRRSSTPPTEREAK